MTTKTQTIKNLELSGLFVNHLTKNPKAFPTLPEDAELIFIDSKDEKLKKRNLELARELDTKSPIYFIYLVDKKKDKWRIKKYK